MSWGHGFVQRAVLAELRHRQTAIDTSSLLRAIYGREFTHSQGQSGRRVLRILVAERAVLRHRTGEGMLFWTIAPGR